MPPILQLAPLHGITNRVFRNAYAKHFGGFDSAMAPFILSVHASDARGAHFKDLLPEYNVRLPVVPQILSNDAEGFVATANLVAGLGYAEVNWNLGCPYPMVTNKKRGAGLLPHPELVKQFLEAACARLTVPLSVKLRLGLVDAREIIEIMPVFNAFPLKHVIIHPRVGAQLYGGDVDLGAFSAAAELSVHPVMYNGDIRSAATFQSLQQRFPLVDGWMIGRGAVSNPFLPGLLKGGAMPADPVGKVRAFHDELYFSYREILEGQKHVLDKMKELWTFFGQSVSAEAESYKTLSKALTFPSYEAAVRSIFSGATWQP
jgi:tRNA-dihydrouridine synthase